MVQAVTIQRLISHGQHEAFFEFTSQRLVDSFLPNVDVVTTLPFLRDTELEIAQHFAPSAERMQCLLKQSKLSIGGELLRRLGIYFFARGQYQKACKCFADGSHEYQLDEEKFEYLAWQVISLMANGSTTQARALADISGKLFRENSLVDLTAMNEMMQHNEFDKLKQLCRKLMQTNSMIPGLREAPKLYLAIALSPNERVEALQLLGEAKLALSDMPSTPQRISLYFYLYGMLGFGYVATGEPNEAISNLNEAARTATALLGENVIYTVTIKAAIAETRATLFDRDLENVTWEQLCVLERESRVLYNVALGDECPGLRTSSDFGFIVSALAESMMLKVKKCFSSKNDQVDYDSENFVKDVEETKQLLMTDLRLAADRHGILAPSTIVRVPIIHEFLRKTGTRNECKVFVCGWATLMLDAISHGENFPNHGRGLSPLKKLSMLFMRYHSACATSVAILREHLRQCKRYQSDQEVQSVQDLMFEMLKWVQTRQTLIGEVRHCMNTIPGPNTLDDAWCAHCDMVSGHKYP